jgi:hypothetical protein
MFLVHTPTGLGVFLGKRMGYGWYTSDTHDTRPALDALYDKLQEMGYPEGQDQFSLVMEDESGNTMEMPPWRYSGTSLPGRITQLNLMKD